MTETQRRIEAYKAALPDLRERVIAVALLLVMSAAMMTSASFAWLTISRAPEVTAVSTTVAANGNLEIALATGDGKTPPKESKVGDSSTSKSIVEANKTWGNLINLGDPIYGLDHLILRPARINESDLLESPFYGAVYDDDGRIAQLKSNFDYTIWQPPTDKIEGKFVLTDQFGVRAISSTKSIESDESKIEFNERFETATSANVSAQEAYEKLKDGKSKTNSSKTYMNALGTIMGKYLTAELNDGEDPDLDIADVEALRDLYGDFIEAFKLEAKAVSELVNFQMYVIYGNDFDEDISGYTVDDVYNLKAFPNNRIKVTGLSDFVKDWKTVENDYELLNDICDPEEGSKPSTVKYSKLESIVSNLVNVGTCKVDGYTVNYLSSHKSEAINIVMNGPDVHNAIITNGILWRFEIFTGARLHVDKINIPVKFMINMTLKSSVDTDASEDYFSEGLDYTTKTLYTGPLDMQKVAEDTYGLAVDFWVRTNAKDSYLVLEGNVNTKSEMVPAFTKDSEGTEVELYSYSVSGTLEDGTKYVDTFDVYQKDGTWYNDISHTLVEIPEGITPTRKTVEKITVLGYEGENRVWDSSKIISTDVTTQGSGSCYVYYADTPEDTERSLVLLKSFVVAFVDGEGELLCTAYMDTERYYAENGRITVPLKLSPNDSTNIGQDDFFNNIYAITKLEEDVPTRITALVYLDGSELTNDEVLAAADIQGQLNIQFGSSVLLEPIDDENLQNQEVSVTASVTPTYFEFDKASEANPMTSEVTVTVSGFTPKTVKAFFIRQINSAQGSREEEMEFISNGDGTWTATHTFTAPGNYILRAVELDGQEYMLSQEILPTVEIKGFSVSSLTITKTDGELSDDGKHVKVLTANSSSYINLSLKLGGSEKIPKKVQGRFTRQDGTAVNVDFTYNPTDDIWTGRANFIASGDYTMQYLLFDGNYEELQEGFRKTADISLGMRVQISTFSPTTIKYVPSEMEENEREFQMRVRIVDNAGEEKRGFTDVTLVYGKRGSSDKTDGDLTWNGEYYVGKMLNKGPGIWEFKHIKIGEKNTITVATKTETFTVRSPEPPKYVSHDTDAYQYTPNKDAEMKALINYSSAAEGCEAYIVEVGKTEGIWVAGERSIIEDTDNANWSFTVPGDENNHDYQDGKWQLTHLRLWGVYDKDGNEYTYDKPLEFDVSDTNNVTKVVNKIDVEFVYNDSIKAENVFNGNFMDPHNVEGISVKIKDFEGAINVDNVKVYLEYTEKSDNYGGYTTDQGMQPGQRFNIALDEAADGMTFSQATAQEIRQAGEYITKVSFDFTPDDEDSARSLTSDSTGVVLVNKAPKFSVYSITPTVKITARTNYGNSENTETTATVEYNFSEGNGCTSFDNYTQPTVTITLAGYGNASVANLKFTEANGETVHLYTSNGGTTSTDSYAWEGNGTCLRWIGYFKSVRAGDDSRKIAGTLTATELVLKYGDKEYKVDIPDITINNPN